MKKRIVLIFISCFLLLTGCGVVDDTPQKTTAATYEITCGETMRHKYWIVDSYEEYLAGISDSPCDPKAVAILNAIDPFLQMAFSESSSGYLGYYGHNDFDMKYYTFESDNRYRRVIAIFPKDSGGSYGSLSSLLKGDIWVKHQEFPESLLKEDLMFVNRDEEWFATNEKNSGYHMIGNAYYYWSDYQDLHDIAFETDEYLVIMRWPFAYTSMEAYPELAPYFNLSTAPDAINAMIAAANGETVQ